MGSEAGGASVSSSSDEAESAGSSREKSSIDAGSEGDVMEVGERRFACWSGGCAGPGELFLSLLLPFWVVVVVLVIECWVVVVLIECRVGRFGVDLE